MKLTDKQKTWLRGQADIVLNIEPSDVPLRGNVLACGDDAEDRRAELEIQHQLENGNEWAWFDATVTLSWKGFEGVDHLGACSYRSEHNFKSDQYFADMVSEAFDRLVESIESDLDSLDTLLRMS